MGDYSGQDGWVHTSKYEAALEKLEEILGEDPSYETQEEEDFVKDLDENQPNVLAVSQVQMINRMHARYVLGEEPEEEPDDDEDDA